MHTKPSALFERAFFGEGKRFTRALPATRRRRRSIGLFAVIGMASALTFGGNANSAAIVEVAAVLPTLPSSTQFDVTGFLQSASLDQACVTAAGASLDAQGHPKVAHCGGSLVLNGHNIVVPAESVVILPASALTWQELFALSPAPYTGVATGIALNDSPKPTTTYEVQVVGNRVISGGQDRYIAGLIHVSQQDLSGGAGYINFMDYNTGELEVGGTVGVAGTGARVQINDPANPSSGSGGRYGRAKSADSRFMVDQDNPTIASATGFPMCFPRVAPSGIDGVETDPLCPQANRPKSTGVADALGAHPPAGEFDTLIRTKAPGTGFPDPAIQAPFEVGDYIDFSGTLIRDGGAGGGYFVSTHTISDNTAIYTQPGTDPAYVSIEVALIGTGGLTVFGAGEAVIRTKFEGMSTDETRGIHLYGIDINPATGATSDRDWGTILPDPGPPGGAVRGRWRFRPPCLASGTVPTNLVRQCVNGPANTFLPPTREVRAVIEGHQQFLPGSATPNPASQVPGSGTEVASANGILYGQYHAPIGEYIFPENTPGNPIVENNFNTIDFLAYGGYQSFTGVQAGVLNPWPSNVAAPSRVCATPTLNGAPYSVANGGTIQLSGSVNANATSPVSVAWTAGTLPNGTDLNGALTAAATSTPTFNATGLAAGVYNLTFKATNVCGATSAATTITVQAAPPPTMNAIQNQTVTLSSTAASPVTVIATTASVPAPKITWLQTGGPAVAFTQTPLAATPTATSTLTFTPTVAGTYNFSVTATNANGTSPSVAVTITVSASVPTNVAIPAVEYRTSKQRLVFSATTTDLAVNSMVLQPYLTENGTMFDPATLGAATLSTTGGGVWNYIGVGVPRPACNLTATYATPCAQKPLTVKALTGGAASGTSVATALTNIRT
jgi:hypothetical protein